MLRFSPQNRQGKNPTLLSPRPGGAPEQTPRRPLFTLARVTAQDPGLTPPGDRERDPIFLAVMLVQQPVLPLDSQLEIPEGTAFCLQHPKKETAVKE